MTSIEVLQDEVGYLKNELNRANEQKNDAAKHGLNLLEDNDNLRKKVFQYEQSINDLKYEIELYKKVCFCPFILFNEI